MTYNEQSWGVRAAIGRVEVLTCVGEEKLGEGLVLFWRPWHVILSMALVVRSGFLLSVEL